MWYTGAACTAQIGGATSNTYVASPAATTTYYYKVTDASQGSPAAGACSAGDTVTVNPALAAGAITPAFPTIDNGQSITLTSNPSGGTTPYGYTWYTGAACTAQIAGATSNTYVASPAATTTYFYKVTDASQGTPASGACSAGDTVTVNPVLAPGGVTPSSPSIDVGQSLDLAANPSGGTQPYSYQWYSSASGTGGCAGTALGTSSTQSTGDLATNTYFCYVVTDSSAAAHESGSSAWDMVTVDSTLVSGSVSPSSVSIDAGQTIGLTSTPATGGTAPITYQWYTVSTTCTAGTLIPGATGTSYTTPALGVGTYYYCIWASDSSAGGHETVYSNVATITVNSVLASGTVSPSSISIDATQTTTLTSTAASGGTDPITYQWYSGSLTCSSGTPIAGATGTSYTTPALSAGTFYYCVWATDSSGSAPQTVYSNVATVMVNAQLTATVSPSSPSIDSTQTVTLTVGSTGGTPAITYQWYTVSTTCSAGSILIGATGTTYTTPELTVGTYYYCSWATDSSSGNQGHQVAYSNVATVAVNPDPTLTQHPSTAQSNESGQINNFTASVTGGSNPFSYQWLVNGSAAIADGYAGANSPLFQFHPVHPGVYQINVTTVDSANWRLWTAAVTETVSLGPEVTLSANRATLDLGDSAHYYGNETGGSHPLNFTWYLNHTLVQWGQFIDWNFTPAGAAFYNVTFEVTDFQSSFVNKTLMLVVFADPKVSNPVAAPGSVDLTQGTTFSATATLGSGGYTYVWSGLPSGCTPADSASISCTPGATGTSTVSVRITDSNGHSANSGTLSFTVYPDPTVTLPSGSPPSAGADNGQTISFSTTAASGSGGYSYVWSGLPTGCSTSNADPLSCTPSGVATNTTFQVWVSVTDSNGFTVSSTHLNYTVNAAPVVTTPTGLPTTADNGQTVTFSTTATLGSGSYTFAWSGLPGCASASTRSLTCVTSGVASNTTFTISVKVTDSNGLAVTSSTLSYTVDADPTTSTPAGNPGLVDNGQTVTFSTTATLGSGGYSFVWSGLPGCASADTRSLACVTSGVASNTTFSISVRVTDSNGFAVTSSTLSYTVDADPIVTTPVGSPASGLVDSGQPVTFTTTASLGAGGYSFVWSGLPSGCLTSDTLKLSCTPSGVTSNTTFLVVVSLTDAKGFLVSSAALSYTVDADPVVTAPVASPVSVDEGQAATFSTTVTLGSGGYDFAWSGLPTGCASTDALSLTCTPNGSGTFTVSVKVTDSNSYPVTSQTLTFTVYVDPSVGAPALSIDPMDLGQSITFTANPSGGLAPYSYSWSGLPGGCSSTAASFTCIPASTGTYSITVNVTDDNGMSVQSTASSLTINLDPLVTQLPSTVQTNESGQINNFTATVSLGTTPYSYQWMINGSIVAGANSAVFAFHPQHPGNYTVNVTVVDGAGWRLWTPAVMESVYPGPQVMLSASTSSIDLGGNVTYTGTETGGVSPLSFSWYLNGTIVQSGPYLNWNFTPVGAATYNVTLEVTDAKLAHVFSTTLTLVVYADPRVSVPIATPGSVDLGQSTTISVTASLGSGGYSYVWSGLPDGCTPSDSPSITCGPQHAGTYNFSVVITDSNGYSVASAVTMIVIFVDPTVTTPTASPSGTDVGGSVTFTSASSGGSGGNTYTWSGLPASCTPPNAPRFTCVIGESGAFTVKLSVRDSNGFSVTSSALSYTVYPDPTVSLNASRPTLDANQLVILTATAGKGTGIYTYSYTSLPAGCTSSDNDVLSCSPTTSGTFSISVNVTDSNEFSVLSNAVTLVISPDPSVGAVSATPTAADLGQNVTFSVSLISTGSGGDVATWSGVPAACAAADSLTVGPCMMTEAGVLSINVSVKDSNGFVAYSKGLSFTVDPAPTVTMAANVTVTDAGQGVKLTLTISATGTYTVQWFLNGSAWALPPSGASSYTFVPAGAGTYSFTAKVTDSLGGTGSTTAPTVVSVNPMPVPTISGPSGSVTVGNNAPFTLTVSGGTSPFTYQWFVNGSAVSGATGSTFTYVPKYGGTYTITVAVHDTVGASAMSAPWMLAVVPATHGTSPGLLSGDILWFIIAAIAALAIILFLVVARRRKHKEEAPAAAAGATAVAATTEAGPVEPAPPVPEPDIAPQAEIAPSVETPLPAWMTSTAAAPEPEPEPEAAPEAAPEPVPTLVPAVEEAPPAEEEAPVPPPEVAPAEGEAPPEKEPFETRPLELMEEKRAQNLFDDILLSAGIEVPAKQAAPTQAQKTPGGPRCPKCGAALPSEGAECVFCSMEESAK
jgi:hypothetical protein